MLLKGPPPRPPGLADVVELRQQSLHQLMALFADERRLVSTHPAKVHDFQPNDITAQGGGMSLGYRNQGVCTAPA
jgi:hypothetical protein